MKTNLIRFSLVLVLLAGIPQMSSSATFVGAAQNSNSSTTTDAPKPMINPCKRRCMIRYRKCLHWAGANLAKRKSCAIKYRRCLHNCGRR